MTTPNKLKNFFNECCIFAFLWQQAKSTLSNAKITRNQTVQHDYPNNDGHERKKQFCNSSIHKKHLKFAFVIMYNYV